MLESALSNGMDSGGRRISRAGGDCEMTGGSRLADHMMEAKAFMVESYRFVG